MNRVTGIGGIFFKANDAPALQAWYKRHLGIDVQEWGGTAFTWRWNSGNRLPANDRGSRHHDLSQPPQPTISVR